MKYRYEVQCPECDTYFEIDSDVDDEDMETLRFLDGECFECDYVGEFPVTGSY
jgi:hypothetical protein